MMWSSVKGDLSYNYTRFLLKTLSSSEAVFMKRLRDGVDDFVNNGLDWVNNNLDVLNSFHDSSEWYDFYYNDSDLEMILMTIFQDLTGNYNKPIQTFYNTGSKIAFNHMGKTPLYTSVDDESLQNLQEYVDTVAKSIQSETAEGIVKTVGTHIDNKSLDKINGDLVTLPYTPVNSRFSVDTRCLFTSKTEYGRAVNTGLLQAYNHYNVDQYDWVTSGLSNVCEKCLIIEAESPYTLNEIINLMPVHVNCYMYDTQVFTNNGWKYFYELSTNDKMLSLNPNTYTTEFIKYNKLIKTKNPFGYMYHIYNRWFDICVTPNHDCFVLQRKRKKSGSFFHSEFRKPNELNSESYFLRKVENNNSSPVYVDVNGLKFKTRDYIFFMAWYISEGNVLYNKYDAEKRRYPVYINQLNKEEYNLLEKELKRICEYLDITIFCGKRTFELHSKELYEYLYPLGYSHEKYIPNELFKLSKEDLNYFLENYIKGDGHEQKKSNHMVSNSRERTVFTLSSKLVDGLSYLILLAGYYPSISLHSKKGKIIKHYNGEYAQNHDIYRISINNSRTTLFSSCNVEKLKYNGDVYCVELPKYHTLWVRRNGKTSWNGNCVCSVKGRLPNNLHRNNKPRMVDLTPKK